MEKQVKESLLNALYNEEKPTMDEAIKSTLITCLIAGDKAVLDSGEDVKKRGRPRKEVCRAEDPSKCWKHGFGRQVQKEQAKEKLRKQNRLNPQPTVDMQKMLDLDASIRELGWDINDPPDSDNETQSMVRDIDNLRREAGLKRIDESFEPYGEYRRLWKEYETFKKESSRLHKQAQNLIDKEKYQQANELYKSIKNRPQEISDRYQKILDAYDNVCNALCDILDSSANDKGAKNPDSLEVERQGFGMMNGEDCKTWQKRMRSLGKTQEIPETIKKIDDIVAQTERRWRSVAGISKEEFEVVKKNFRKTFENLMKRCALATNRGIAGVNGVLEDHLKSQHDMTKKGKRFEISNHAHHAIIGGSLDDPRYKFARKCFGVEKNLKESKYEKYGCLHTLNPYEDDNYMGAQYGRNVIRWKPHKVVATMTFSDSLCLSRDGLNYVNPCLVTNPSPCCFNPENREIIETLKAKPLNIGLESLCSWLGAPYCELQLHGEDIYDASAIESISFGSEDDVKNLSKEAIVRIKENVIQLFLEDKPIELDASGAVKKNRN